MTTDTYNSGSGNWTVPSGVTSVQIELWGGGGGGGGGGTGSGSNDGAGGGGSGGYCKKDSLAVTPGGTVAYVVGGGGAGSTAENIGINGSVSTASGGAYTANGGNGGKDGENIGATSVTGGTASGGDTNTTGGSGGSSRVTNAGGVGGTAPGGGGAGGAGGTVGSNGSAGTAPGAGGGGGSKTNTGGAGASGRVVFTYTATVATAAEGVTILRPISDLNYQWWQYGFDNIDDDLTQPTGSAGDGLFCNVQAELAGAQQWGVLAPYPTHTIYGAKVWLRAKYEVYPAKISGIRIRLGGTWYDYGNPNETLNLVYTWYGYGITGLSVSASGADPAIEIYMAAVPGGAGYVGKMDVAYLELDYTPIGGSGVIVGVGTFSGAGRVRGGTGEVIGVGAFSGSGGKHGGAGGVVGTGDLSGVGLAVHFGFGDVTGSGSLSGAGPPYFGGFGTITGVGTLSGEGPPPTMLTALAAAVEALGLPPIMVTALTTVAETLGTGDPPPPDVTALAISTEVLGSPVVFEPIYTSAKFLAVETLGGPSLGPWMLFVQGCVVETLGFSGVKSWREHEELFLLPWSTIR